jgi:hypothetical protein
MSGSKTLGQYLQYPFNGKGHEHVFNLNVNIFEFPLKCTQLYFGVRSVISIQRSLHISNVFIHIIDFHLSSIIMNDEFVLFLRQTFFFTPQSAIIIPVTRWLANNLNPVKRSTVHCRPSKNEWLLGTSTR